ncbi:MAG TPA: hypothetical protein VG318_13795 [Actinomycetota bacterium]|nr:hypothetical protein [Actinomycetota bacterium]
MNESEVRREIQELILALETLVERDPEQEMHGRAVLDFDAVILSTKQVLLNRRDANAITDAISAEAVAHGEPIRAADALVTAHRLQAWIGPEPAYSQTGRGRRIPGL